MHAAAGIGARKPEGYIARPAAKIKHAGIVKDIRKGFLKQPYKHCMRQVKISRSIGLCLQRVVHEFGFRNTLHAAGLVQGFQIAIGIGIGFFQTLAFDYDPDSDSESDVTQYESSSTNSKS